MEFIITPLVKLRIQLLELIEVLQHRSCTLEPLLNFLRSSHIDGYFHTIITIQISYSY